MVWISYSPNEAQRPAQFPPVATSSAPVALLRAHWCDGLPSFVKVPVVVDVAVRGSRVSGVPSTRTETFAPSATGAATSTTSPAARPAMSLCMEMSHPFPRGFPALWSEGGLLASGPDRSAPSRTARGVQWLRLTPLAFGIPGHSGGSAPVSHRLP